ncbi:hypothetical protein D3C81_2113170 [compost metagenome]
MVEHVFERNVLEDSEQAASRAGILQQGSVEVAVIHRVQVIDKTLGRMGNQFGNGKYPQVHKELIF